MKTDDTSPPPPSLAGVWLDAAQARARAQPGRKMLGSAADHGSRWRLELSRPAPGQPGTFLLRQSTGYDYRGTMSSSGLYDGKVDLTVRRVTGAWEPGAATLRITAARTTHTQGAEPPMLALGLPGGPGSIKERTTEEATGGVLTLKLLGDGRLSLWGDALNGGQALVLVRA